MNIGAVILIAAVGFYRMVLSPAKTLVFGPLGRCRFSPSCSAYAIAALRSHGAWKGGWLSIRRLCRCHPWGGCGCDPVPGHSDSRLAEAFGPGATKPSLSRS